ncbi:hypothetical protein Hhis01_00943 [Haloarcula hispanica]
MPLVSVDQLHYQAPTRETDRIELWFFRGCTFSDRLFQPILGLEKRLLTEPNGSDIAFSPFQSSASVRARR